MTEEEKMNLYARKILGFTPDEILDYQKAVNHYIFMLNYYAIFLDEESFLDADYILLLNTSLNICTLNVLDNYMDICIDVDENLKKQKTNYNYNTMIEATNKIMTRFFKNDKIDVGYTVGRDLYRIANAIYLKETDQKTKIYS